MKIILLFTAIALALSVPSCTTEERTDTFTGPDGITHTVTTKTKKADSDGINAGVNAVGTIGGLVLDAKSATNVQPR